MRAARPIARKNTEGASRYYEEHAHAYCEATLGVDMSDLYAAFLPYIPQGGRILDAGSGSGRDTLAFIKRGYRVEAFDSSPTLAALSSRLTGILTQVLTFQEFCSPPRFDGIWVCASLLHVPERELPETLTKLVAALKPGGALYLSVKHGSGERLSDDGRLFVDLNEDELRSLFAPLTNMTLAKIWITEGEGALRGKDRWLNAIAVKASQKERHA